MEDKVVTDKNEKAEPKVIIHPDSELDIKRFGHSLTLINSNQVVLFGGAKSIIDLYNDCLIYNIKEKSWLKLNPSGKLPSPRAAHSACCIIKDNVVVMGGAKKNGGFASNEFYLLDLTNSEINANWSVILCKDPKPMARYGHSLMFFKPYLILFGGVLKDKNRHSNELWVAKIENTNLFSSKTSTYSEKENFLLEWKLVEFRVDAPIPCPRIYHSLGVIKNGKAKGMIVMFGGRDEQGLALNDCWGLRRHRNYTWEWITAPVKGGTIPSRRFQHVSIFYSNFMIILGGRSEGVDVNCEGLPVEIYDSNKLEWYSHLSFEKFRHSVFTVDKYAFVHGGCELFNPTEPTDKIVMFDVQELCLAVQKKQPWKGVNVDFEKNGDLKEKLSICTTFTAANIKPVIVNKADISFVHLQTTDTNTTVNTSNLSSSIPNNGVTIKSNLKTLNSVQTEIKKISLDEKNKFETIKNDEDDYFELYENFIHNLLKPSEWKTIKKSEEAGIPKFRFRREHIIALTKACQEVVASQPLVLRLNAPIKVFGDIHGQYDDLMRFFELWGEPSENPGVGDINSIDYLFLGDYVDRGVNSLETICLLMALKIKYPDKIHLLRGNHEDHLINSTFGFSDECEYRLSDDTLSEELNVFKVVNEFFEYLPLAAVIEDQILCLHGGIGSCLSTVDEIEQLQRPLTVVHEANMKSDQIVMDILWSDPTDNDDEKGIQPNFLRDSKCYGNIVKFGPDIVQKFLEANNLYMIIRAHECVPEGFERFCGGSLITIFSATDYCKRHKNAGAMLLIKNNFEIVPHLIYPISSPNIKWIDNDESLKVRPPTPLRNRPQKDML